MTRRSGSKPIGEFVAQPRRSMRAGDGAQSLLNRGRGQPAFGQPAGSRLDYVRPRREFAADDRKQVDRRIETSRLGEPQRLRRGGHEKAGAAPRLDRALRHQAVIAFDDSGLGDAEFFGEPSHRRQARAAAERPAVDPGAQSVDDEANAGRRRSAVWGETVHFLLTCPITVSVQFSGSSAICLYLSGLAERIFAPWRFMPCRPTAGPQP